MLLLCHYLASTNHLHKHIVRGKIEAEIEAVQTTPTPPRSALPLGSAKNLGGEGLREGCKIEHQRFGIGTVIKIEGTGENTKATVEFRNTGTKQLLLKFAKFKIIATD